MLGIWRRLLTLASQTISPEDDDGCPIGDDGLTASDRWGGDGYVWDLPRPASVPSASRRLRKTEAVLWLLASRGLFR